MAFGVAAAAAQSPDTFTPVANLTVPWAFHTSTLLPNGTVLIAGGFSEGMAPFSTWDTAEIYDPVRATFVSTGQMTAARQMHTATLLPNGTVLIAGVTVANCQISLTAAASEVLILLPGCATCSSCSFI